MLITHAGPVSAYDTGWDAIERLAAMAPRKLPPGLGQMWAHRRDPQLGQYVEAATTAYSIIKSKKGKKKTHEQREAERRQRVTAKAQSMGFTYEQWMQLRALAQRDGYALPWPAGSGKPDPASKGGLKQWIDMKGGPEAVRGLVPAAPAAGPGAGGGGILTAGFGGGGGGTLIPLVVAGLVVAPLVMRRGRR